MNPRGQPSSTATGENRRTTVDIPALRSIAGVTQTDLAQALGVQQPTVARWESLDRHPDERWLARLAAYFSDRLVDLAVGTLLRMVERNPFASALGNSEFVANWKNRMREMIEPLVPLVLCPGLVSMTERAWVSVFGLKPEILDGIPRRSMPIGSVLAASDVGLRLAAQETVLGAEAAGSSVVGELRVRALAMYHLRLTASLFEVDQAPYPQAAADHDPWVRDAR